jgi:hypothetical protein
VVLVRQSQNPYPAIWRIDTTRSHGLENERRRGEHPLHLPFHLASEGPSEVPDSVGPADVMCFWS